MTQHKRTNSGALTTLARLQLLRDGYRPMTLASVQAHINAETIRRENRAWRSTALIITTAILALAIGALLAMAQITIAALPDIIAQSAARNAW